MNELNTLMKKDNLSEDEVTKLKRLKEEMHTMCRTMHILTWLKGPSLGLGQNGWN